MLIFTNENAPKSPVVVLRDLTLHTLNANYSCIICVFKRQICESKASYVQLSESIAYAT